MMPSHRPCVGEKAGPESETERALKQEKARQSLSIFLLASVCFANRSDGCCWVGTKTRPGEIMSVCLSAD